MILAFSASLTISTLHSHHHLEWNHPPDFADTGNCITADTTMCPICGYHLKIDMPASGASEAILVFDAFVDVQPAIFLPESLPTLTSGRSPPAV